MGIWQRLQNFSAFDGTSQRPWERAFSGQDQSVLKTRGLQLEKFEDRVLLSINPAGDYENALWEETLAREIERASDLSQYRAEDLVLSGSDTMQWVVGVSGSNTVEQRAANSGASSLRAADFLANGYVWQFAAGMDWQEAAAQLESTDGVDWAYPLVPVERVRRFVPDDPLFVDQWHLENTGQTGGLSSADTNVVSVWDQYLGTGVVIGVVDDGLDNLHEDLVDQYRSDLSWDFRYGDPDPMHDDVVYDGHGTSVAGVAAATGNNALGGSGVAPGAELAGLRLIGGAQTDLDEAAALTYSNQQIAIYNNSWGVPDASFFTPTTLDGPGPNMLAAMRDDVINGRGGLGNILVWSGGNGYAYGDDVNYDGYANSRYTIAVGAIDHFGQQAYYSEPGAPLLVTAYSDDGFFGTGITTTDWTGAYGDDPGDYTSNFGGTSSATPVVSGVIALMLEANPSLTYRDVQHVLVESAKMTDPADSDWVTNAAGYDINHKYGFGAIDAQAAVNTAKTWETVGPEVPLSSGLVGVGLTIPDASPVGVSSNITLANDVGSIEWVEVIFSASHTYGGDLEVVLVSPTGTESVLAESHVDTTDYDNWTFTSARHWGEMSGGDWTLIVRDQLGGDVGTFDSWELKVYGQANAGSGPELIAIIPNDGDLLDDGEVLNIAPRELTFRFNHGQVIDPATLDAIQIVRSGGDDVFGNANDVVIEYGWIGIGDPVNELNEVIVRFSEPLPDDLYQITIAGTGATPLLNDVGQIFQWDNDLQSGEDLVVEFELDLGAQVVAIVPQPVVRDVSGGLTQLADTIEVFFNEDPLDQTAAENVDFYCLFFTNETADSTDDVEHRPTAVRYDQGSNKAVLTFGADLSTYGTGAYRLRIGNDYEEIVTSIEVAGSDNNSSFATAQNLGALGAGFTAESKIISAQIEPQPYDLVWPGANDEPGHRDLPVVGTDVSSEEHIPFGDAPDTTTDIIDQSYDFNDIYGALPGGPAYNLITEQQKDRVRELFELYKTYYGAQFSEMIDDGLGGADMTIAHGDVRALGAPGGPGVVAGVAAGGGWNGTAIMDNPDFQAGSHEFGGSWFQVAMHEILHLGSLLHTYDLPPLTIMGSGEGGTFYDDEYEAIFPGAHDIVHGQHMYRPDSTDIDLYEFTVDREGVFSAETVSERRDDSERLDSMLTLYKFDPTDPQVPWKKVARNDDYFSDDAYLEVLVEPGTYTVAVTASGNFDFDPTISDSGIGGTTYGEYDLRLNFRPEGADHMIDATGTRFDGDADGVPGGIYDAWFNVQTAERTLFVDKENTSGFEDGTLAQPFRTIPSAFSAAEALVAAEYGPGDQPRDVPGVIVRVAGNNFENDDASDVTTMQDNVAYEVGIGLLNNWLDDGPKLEVPHKVTLMIDAGAMFKMRGSNLDSGSSAQDIDRSEGHIQVLGTPEHSVYFTSYHDESLGVDTEPLSTSPLSGDWGGVVYRNNLDYSDQERVANTDGPRRVLETEGIFLNYVNHADFRYGGGRVRVNGVTSTYTPVAMVSARPMVSFNLITESATSAISADPNSFLESKFQGNIAGSLYTADYDRVGPDIHMNRFVAHYEGEDPSLPKHTNTLNGLMVGIATLAGQPTDELDVSARFDDWDVVHVISANLQINGTPGGPVIDRDTGIHMAREDARLAVDPGVVVKLDGSRIEAEMSTQLIAEGTAGYPIIFTSLMDDRYGGGGTFDTSENGTDVMPSPGDWGGLYFSPVSRGSIDNIRMFYGGGETTIEGGFAEFDPIEMRQAFVRITNSLFEFNDTGTFGDRNGRGTVTPAVIHVRGAQPVIAGNVFSNNLGPMISIDANSLIWKVMTDWGRSTGDLDAFEQYADNTGPLIRENQMWNNGTNGMTVRGVTLHTGTVWDDSDIVHVLLNEILVPNHHSFSGIRLQSNVGESLVVKLDGPEAGITASGKPQEIDDRIGGTVQIMGAPGFPVVLTSLADDTVGAGFDPWDRPMSNTNNSTATPEPGDWRSILLKQYSNDRNVAVVNELEDPFGTTDDLNSIPESSEHLGQLATLSKAGDENLRLGFELHGSIRLDDPGDVDVYAFDATAGTKVWFDIDNTRHALDTILELINVNGDVLASSDNSFFEFNTEPTANNLARRLDDDSWFTKDHNSTNAMDPGFNLVLPGPEGQVRTYYVRVRSAPAAGAPTEPGITRGQYQLQVRLSNLQEVPGSFIKFADIRYATNGVDTAGLPIHSPLLIEAFEQEAKFGSDNDTFNTAEEVGNLLESDRNTIGIGGYLGSSSDVDWYKFEVDYEGIQSIGGVNDSGSRFPIVFDVDYADGMGRPDVHIFVYDSTGSLVLFSDDSNIVDDKPGPLEGADVSNLQRGTFGGYDSYIGTLHVPEGGGMSYYVAVTSMGMAPDALGQPFLRREPLESTTRIAEDHVGSQFTSGIPRADSAVALLPEMNAHADEFSLGDVVMYVSVNNDLYTVDPFTGAFETDVTGNTPGDFLLPDTVTGASRVTPGAPRNPHLTYGDIAMRNDGRLYTFTRKPGSLNVNRNDWAGRYRELDTGDARIFKSDHDDGITTYQFGTNPPALEELGNNLHGPASVPDETGGISFEAMAHGYGNRTVGNNPARQRGLLAVGNVGLLRALDLDPLHADAMPWELPYVKNLLYLISEDGTAIDYPGTITTGGPRLTSDIIPLARLLTGTSLIVPESGATDEEWPFSPDILDATRFTLRDVDGDPTELVFEMDCGPDIRLDPSGARAVRDGEAFLLDTGSGPQIFEFDSGPVLVVDSFLHTLTDGEAFTIQDNSTLDADPSNDNSPVTFEFEDTGAATPDGVIGTNVAIDYTAGMNSLNLLQVIVDTINAAGFDVTAQGFLNGSEIRVSLENDIALLTTPTSLVPPGPLGFDVEGDYGSFFPVFPNDPTSNRHVIYFEETMPVGEFGLGSAGLTPYPGILSVISNALPSLRPGLAHRTGEPGVRNVGDRLTLYNASDYSFVPSSASLQVDPPGDNNSITLWGNTPGAQLNDVDVIFTNTSGLGNNANITWVPGPGIPPVGGTLTIEVDPAATTANRLIQQLNASGAPFTVSLDLQDAAIPPSDGSGFMLIDGNVGQTSGGIIGVPSFTHVDDAHGQLSENGVSNVADVTIAFDADDGMQDIVTSITEAINMAILAFPNFAVSAASAGNAITLNGIMLANGAEADLPLRVEGEGTGGFLTGMTWVNQHLYAVDDAGGLFEIVDPDQDNFSAWPPPNATPAIKDPPDRIVESLPANGARLRWIGTLTEDMFDPEAENLGIVFEGLSTGPPNVEGGRYAQTLFAVSRTGGVYAFDTSANPQPIFLDGASMVQLRDQGGAALSPGTPFSGIDFSTIDYNLWHTTNYRRGDRGHGVRDTFTESRPTPAYPIAGGTSFYFGLEDPRPPTTITNQPGATNYIYTNTADFYTYDMPGGAHGSFTTDTFSLVGYDPADQPTFFFNYFLDAQNGAFQDAARVYISTDGADWDIVASNTDRDDPYVGGLNPADVSSWRQGRIGLAGYAGQEDLRIRFDFNTASNLNVGDQYSFRSTSGFDTTGAYLRAVPGTEIIDGETFVVDDVDTFEFDMGARLVVPSVAGWTIPDAEAFRITAADGSRQIFEFENPDAPGYVPGRRNATARLIQIDHGFTTNEVVQAISNAINAANLPGISVLVHDDRVLIHGTLGVTQSGLLPTALIIEGTGRGIAAGNIPVFVRPNMTSDEVATAIAVSLDQFYSNSRLFQAVDGTQLFDGRTFTLDDGYNPVVTFEFNNPAVNPAFGGDVQVPFNAGSTATDVAVSIINAVNNANNLNITASNDPTDPTNVVLNGVWVVWDLGATPLMPLLTVDTPGEYTSSKVDGDLIHMIGHGIPPGMNGPLPYSNFLPGDYRHQLPQFGDSQFFSNARGQNDTNEGFYIDDLVIGFTERGELITDSTSQTTFSSRDPGISVTEGYYQLEIRRGDEDGIWPDPPLPPTLNLDPLYYDTNDRMRNGITLFAPDVKDIDHLDTFDISDGESVVTFQFVNANVGGANPNFESIEFFGMETPGDIGSIIADVINAVAFDGILNVTASSIETSERVDLNGAYWATPVGGLEPMVWGNLGDENLLFRDQGQTIIESTRVTHSEEWGIRIDAGTPDGVANYRHPAAPGPLRQINTEGLVPGIILQNNVTAFGGSGGIYIGGDPINQPAAAAPFVKVVNNTIYGGGATQVFPGGDIGIQVGPNASPTLLNNVVANMNIGVQVDASSSSTVLGGTIFQDNFLNTTGTGLGNFAKILPTGDPLFVNPQVGNFYPDVGSQIIDSSVDNLEDRPSLTAVRDPLGIPESPILAPVVDLFGQVRTDDPNVSPPPGIGFNVYKDRGAIDRVDFAGPTSQLIEPLDNDAVGLDRNSTRHDVFIAGERLTQFAVQLFDEQGVGVDDASVTSANVEVWRDDTLLSDQLDYFFEYNSTNDVIYLIPAPGVWLPGHVYSLVLNNQGIRDDANNALQPNRTDGSTVYNISLAGLDFGDAPDPTFPTLFETDGARHVITGGYLGSGVTSEPNARQNSDATSDTLDDGVHFDSALLIGNSVGVTITASQPGKLDAWIDFNDDGDWLDFGEQIFNSIDLTTGDNLFNVSTPAGLVEGEVISRFRFSEDGNLTTQGEATDGEVEDYQIRMVEFFEDFGDAPDLYRTMIGRNGARHTISGLFLGTQIDNEPDGQPNLAGTGDDDDGNDDDDGIEFLGPLVPGTDVGVSVTVSQAGGILQGWLDFNADGDWNDVDEQIFTNVSLPIVGENTLTVSIPNTVTEGNTFARFRVSTQTDLISFGSAQNGEVEDYRLTIVASPEDYGDAPDPTYPTLVENDGARHSVEPGFHLGSRVDFEFLPVPSLDATGDDADNFDDEDGVRFSDSLMSGEDVTLTINASDVGYLNAWIDFNADGDWLDPDEQIFTDELLAAGDNVFTLSVPRNIVSGDTFARFRFSHEMGLLPTTPEALEDAPDGEVEDYMITMTAGNGEIRGRKFNDLNANGLFDYGEPGMANIAIYLDQNDNGILDPNEPTTLSAVDDLSTTFINETGEYLFDGLFDDVYIVREIVPTDWVQTAPITNNSVGGISTGVLKTVQSVDGTQLNDGNTFTISDGAVMVRFELEDLFFSDGVNPVNIAFPFNMSDTADQVAVALGNAISTAAASSGMQLTTTVRSDVVILKGATVSFDPESSVLSPATSHSNTDGSYTIVLDPSAVVTDADFANFRTPHISVSDVSVAEGDVRGQTVVNIELNLTESFGADVEVSYSTQDGDPTQGPAATVFNDDYEPVSDTFLFTPVGVPSSSWGTTVLTDNLPNDYDYHISGNRVAWEGFDGNDWEIFLAIVNEDGTSEIRQLTDNDTHDEKPFVFESGVVWSGVPDTGAGADPMDDDLEIYHYQIDPRTTTRITTNLLDNKEPQLSNSHITWWAESGLDSDIFLYDLATGGYPRNISNNSTNDYDPRISGGVVVWSGIDSTTTIDPDREIFVYDALAAVPQVVQITSNTDPDLYPEIDGTNIVWQGGTPTDTDVFVYQMDALTPTVVNLTSGAYPSRNQNPHISGENIVWQGWNGYDWEIWYQHVSAYTPRNISTSTNNDQNPRIAGSHVVWASHNAIDRDWDAYYVDLTLTNEPANISMSTDREWKPQIAITGQGLDTQPFVGWRGFDGTDYEIVVAQPSTPTVTQTVTLIINGDRFFEDDETFYFNVDGATISVAGTNTGIPVTIDDNQATIEILNDDGSLDFGDAPEQGTLYPTTIANNGARHLVSGSLYLGSTIDADPDGRPHSDALGDDFYITDDEDGVVFGDLAPGSTATITVTASRAGRLDAWFDFNADGDWDDLGEQVFDDSLVFTGSNTRNVSIPAYAVPGQLSYARFRLSTNGVASYTGSVADGEVEDYQIEFVESVVPVNPFEEDPLTGTITVPGTDGVDDHLVVTAGQVYTIELNGFQKQYNLAEFDHVVFDGGTSTSIDSAIIYGTIADDTMTLDPGAIEFIGGDGLTVNISQTENITVNGGGGNDWARLDDSAGDDTLVMTPHNASLTGPGFVNTVEDVDIILAYALYGGNDSADFTGSDSIVEEFYVDAYLGIAKIITTDYALRSKHFEEVAAHGTGPNDHARMKDSAGNDLFEAWPDHSILSGPGYIVETDSFAGVHAYAPSRTARGIDEARLYGSPGDDKFTGTTIYSRLENQPGNPTEFVLRSKFFEKVYGDAGAGNDEVKLFDSLGNDHLEAQDDWVQVNNIADGSLHYDFLFRIADVESGRATANEGGNDTKSSTVDWLMFYEGWAD